MNFLLDENVPSILKKVLREEGHIISTLKDLDLSQLVNGELAKIARDRNKILITFDADFTQLKSEIRRKLKVIYFKFNRSNPELASILLKRPFENLPRLFEKTRYCHDRRGKHYLFTFLNYLEITIDKS